MKSSSRISRLETVNPRVLDFYERTGLDFESMNLLIIEIYEKMSSDISGTLNRSMKNDIILNIRNERTNNEQFRKEILSTLNNSVELYKNEISTIKNFNTILTNEVMGLRDIIMKLNSDLSNSIVAKLFEIKQSYVDEIKSLILSNDSSNILKLMDLIERENVLLVDKTLKTVTDIIPRSNSQSISHIESLINSFKSEINSNIQSIRNTDNGMSIEEISKIIDNKYGNLLSSIQQTMMIGLNSSEERLSKNILELKDFELIKQNDQEKVNTDLMQYLNKFNNSTKKGNHGEVKLSSVLEEIYPLAEVIDTTKESKKCDILLRRNNKPQILIETKSYQNPVSKDEIVKFCRDIEYQNCSGIMFSQTSNISTKENYQIDIINNNVVLYVSNCNYDHDMIKMAVSIIDHLYPKINDVPNKNTMVIDNATMVLINEEYKRFLNQRDAIKNYINDTNKKLISQLYDMELPSLNNILLSRFTITQDINLTCDICKKFVGINKKSLSKHKQACRKKNVDKSSEDDNNERTLSDENIESVKENNEDHINSDYKVVDISDDMVEELVDNIKELNDDSQERILNELRDIRSSVESDTLKYNKTKKYNKSRKYNKTSKNEIEL